LVEELSKISGRFDIDSRKSKRDAMTLPLAAAPIEFENVWEFLRGVADSDDAKLSHCLGTRRPA
jgi:hypothetical protein